MWRRPFLDFQVRAERAGYPALLLVSLLCLAIVVVPFLLLALIEATWVLVVTLLSLVAAVAILSGGMAAALADQEEPDPDSPMRVDSSREPSDVVPLPRGGRPAQKHQGDRRAA
jgi:hypothetical protein